MNKFCLLFPGENKNEKRDLQKNSMSQNNFSTSPRGKWRFGEYQIQLQGLFPIQLSGYKALLDATVV